MAECKSPILELLGIMERLRGPGGCPWDRKQDHSSLRPYVIEEAYELVDAINSGEEENIKEELGDLLLQIVFHCQIASEEKRFDFDSVAKGICEKLVRRHPHVFGDESADSDEDALRNWERIKTETEGKRKAKRHFETPILHRALRLQEKAVSFGFDWEETSQLLTKLEEEIAEIRSAVKTGNSEDILEEVGDLFFMAVNLARFLEIHPEDALERSLSKFSKRFRTMEELAGRDGRSLEQMDIDEMEEYWEKAKNREKEKG
jgi:tetrapyrrole methylase family protein/MazG family protein